MKTTILILLAAGVGFSFGLGLGLRRASESKPNSIKLATNGYSDPQYPVRLQRDFFSLHGALSEAKPGDIILTDSGAYVAIAATFPTSTPTATP